MTEKKVCGMPLNDALELCSLSIVIALVLGIVFRQRFIIAVFLVIFVFVIREIYVHKFKKRQHHV